MATKFLSLFCTISLTLLLTSCTTTMTESVILSTDYEHAKDNGYIYGSFALSLPTDVSSFSKSHRYPTMGIIVQNIDTFEKHSFLLKSNFDEQLQIIALPPGNYRIDSIAYVADNKVSKITNFNVTGYQNNFVVKANTAVYIGDFTGSVSIYREAPFSSPCFQCVGNGNSASIHIEDPFQLSCFQCMGNGGFSGAHIKDPFYHNIRTSWFFEPPISNYDENTAAIKETYQFFTEPPITFVSNMNSSQVSDS